MRRTALRLPLLLLLLLPLLLALPSLARAGGELEGAVTVLAAAPSSPAPGAAGAPPRTDAGGALPPVRLDAGLRGETQPPAERLEVKLIPEKKSLLLFFAAQALVVADMGQTLNIRKTDGIEEANPLLGREPSEGRVYALFGTRLAINTLAYLVLPDRWANRLSMLTIAIGLPVVAHNASLGLSVSF